METVSLSYRYEFAPDELQHIQHCKEQHGFAIVKGLLPPAYVERLKDEVRRVVGPMFQDDSTLSVTDPAFIEKSPAMAELMAFEPLMRLARQLNGHQPLTLNRSAAIYKKPGAAGHAAKSGVHAWHTDWEPLVRPYGANALLNNTNAASLWFYLTGSSPQNGGLAIVPDSHTEDWTGPSGFDFTAGRRSFYPKGAEAVPYTGMDVPGMIPVVTEPGDLVLFAERTYHGVYAHQGAEARLSCGLSFRPSAHQLDPCWPVTESVRRFIEACPVELKHLVDGYVGFDGAWRSGT
ncbi:MAG: hypothetical protein K0Q59_1692 [Paenibacillus sp.]|jgi:ectoine hydroxylase-related dioxygenase (phytanoyl-CoA dioxygenase family)|nr:hypothetical protein [Paenibacillus sp.]